MKIADSAIDERVANELIRIASELQCSLGALIEHVESHHNADVVRGFQHSVGHVLGEYNDIFLLPIIEKFPDLSRSAGLID